MPREVGLALRGGHPFPDFTLRPPAIRWHSVDAKGVDRAATEQAVVLVADIGTILAGWQEAPPKLLKAGGIGVRDIRRAATAIGRPEVDTARVIDMAAVAGLAGWDEEAGVALPRPEYDVWLERDIADRWLAIVDGWLTARLHVSLAGALGTNEKAIPPLLDRGPESAAGHRRLLVLAALMAGSRGEAADADSLAARVTWDAPPIWTGGPALPPTLIAWVLSECEMLGLCAQGALSDLGRAVLGGRRREAHAILTAHTPRLTSEFVIQPDLTAVAIGPLTAGVRSHLDLMADLESSGAATVYRFHEPSLRRAFDAGWTASEVVGFLDAHATKGVPQPLAYLVDDVGRRYGRARVGSATSYVRSDEPSLLTEILVARRLAKLGLRQLAPTVLVSAADPDTVIAALRANGYLPGEEDVAGDLVVRRQEVARAEIGHLSSAAPEAWAADIAGELAQIVDAGVLPPYGSPATTHHDDLVALVGRLRAPRLTDPPKAPTPAPTARSDDGELERPSQIVKTADLIRLLLELSLEHEWWLRLGYVNQRGQAHQLTATIFQIDGKQVDVGTMPGHGVRTLNIDRISWARALTPAEEDAL